VATVRFDEALDHLQVVREGCGSPLRLAAVAVVKVDPYLKRHDRAVGEAASVHPERDPSQIVETDDRQRLAFVRVFDGAVRGDHQQRVRIMR
jgi:hypothetical protein